MDMNEGNRYKGLASLLPHRMAIDLAIEGIETAEKLKKHSAGLAKGNLAASKIKSENAMQYHVLWRQWAIDSFTCNDWDYSRVADHVLRTATRVGHKMANGKPYQVSTIRTHIKGTKEEAKIRS